MVATICGYFSEDDGLVHSFTRWGFNDPRKFLNAVVQAFDTDIVSEHEPRYWGFDSQEEWNAALEELNRKSRDHFYADILRFVSGELNDIREGTVGEIQAKIAEQLVESDPEFLLPEQRDRLMKAVEEIFNRDHVTRLDQSEAYCRISSKVWKKP